AADSLYVLTSGALRFTRQGAPPWTFRGRTAFVFHEQLLGVPRARTCTAIEDTHVLRVPVSAWFSMMEDSFDFTHPELLLNLRTPDELVARPLPDGGHRAPDAPEGAMRGGPSALVDRALALSEGEPFRGAGAQALMALAASTEEITLGRGATLDEVAT